jgi:ABC-type amino acid transport system permease subunit
MKDELVCALLFGVIALFTLIGGVYLIVENINDNKQFEKEINKINKKYKEIIK